MVGTHILLDRRQGWFEANLIAKPQTGLIADCSLIETSPDLWFGRRRSPGRDSVGCGSVMLARGCDGLPEVVSGGAPVPVAGAVRVVETRPQACRVPAPSMLPVCSKSSVP